MDKSEAELLEEWDMVSAYDTEKENDMTEKNGAADPKSSTDDNAENNTDTKTKNNTDDQPKNISDDEPVIIADAEPKNISDDEPVIIAVVEPKNISDDEPVIIAVVEPKNISDDEPVIIADVEPVDIPCAETVDIPDSEPVDIPCAETVDIPDSEPVDIPDADPVNIPDAELVNIATAEPVNIATVEPVNIATAESVNIADAEPENIADAEPENIADIDIQSNTEVNSEDNTDDNSVDDTDENTVIKVDSSLENIEIEHCEGSFVEDIPDLVPDLIEMELESTAIESSSSDIDIIDENVEESISSFLPPLSLSISSSIVDTSSILTSQSEDDKSEQKTEDIHSTIHSERSYNEDRSENVRHHHRESHRTESQRTSSGRSLSDWFALLLGYFCNMSGYNWSLLGGVAISLFLTIVVNQTNIFAIVEKENVMSQMKNVIDELKNDNKMLKEQMLSEMKNEKVFSSFEYQLRELRKENSKLNHMLFDVAKVLENQKYSQEKREAEYLAPFKKEINNLKEHINILKFDNEELQKELVQMRYASYSQGGKEQETDVGDQEHRKDSTEADENAATEEIPLDIESLKKWNDLISLLSKELGMLAATDSLKEEKSYSETKNKKANPIWKDFLQEFKGSFNDFRKINISAIISDYRKANQKAVYDFYRFVKDFFTVEEENTQKFTRSDEKGSQWKNIGDFVNDLSEKWTNIKDRLYTSDLKNFFTKNFKKAGDETSHGEHHSQTAKGSAFEHGEHHSQTAKGSAFEHGESKTSNTHFESEKRHDKVQTPDEDTKWMFKRAAHRAELRDAEEESSVNWYLKKSRHASQDDTKEKHH